VCVTMCAVRGKRVITFLAPLLAVSGAARPNAAHSLALLAKLHAARTSPSDLALSGDLPGVPHGETRYMTRDDLLAPSQPMTISPDDGNFKDAAKVRAIPLEDLTRAFGVPPTDMLIADCKDKYQTHYTRRYLANHHPVLVTELDGAPLGESKYHDYGPYMIAHMNFKPTFKVLAHEDEPQIPWGVVRLEFRNEAAVLAAIAPRGAHAGDSALEDGFKIAQQNCFRCHNNGAEGGLKSGVAWTVLAALAANSPDFFTAYVRDPKSKNPNTEMTASPEYDSATMTVLIAYFRTFAPAAQGGSH
jgi:mono/diheme cytochrome c family protein